MSEAGVDIAGQRSKHLDELDPAALDYVVTVCEHATEACPVLPGPAARRHRGFPDPPRLAADAADETEALTHYRRVRNAIRAYVETLPEALTKAERQQ